ncbi:MAG: prolipoprotein diacylglyceryl transferase [Clostridia bacterium]|nr:prolipoprotein diacylglyceryl transferase [Clostridia bacterium]
MVTVSFPGLGIDNFTLNPVAFTLPIFGGIEVRFYGLIITLGIILAFTYCAYRAKQEGIIFDDLLDIALFTIIFAVIGARAYYVLTSLDKYDSFGEMIAIWNGGLAIYGAIIAGAITILVTCRIKKLSALKMLDATAPAVMIGQILGRWGNFFNGEAYGSVVPENSPLYFIRMGIFPNDIEGVRGMAYVHPTFLYESLWNLCGFLLIHFLYKKKKFDGQVLLMYVTWYGFGRMFIEGLRTDSLYVGVFRISQVLGFLCFVVGAILLILNLAKARRAELTAKDYAPAYGKITGATAAFQQPQNDEPSETDEEETVDTQADEQQENPSEEDPFVSEGDDTASRRIFDLFGNNNKDETK